MKPVAYINVEERKLEWAQPITWHTPTIAQMDKIPLYIIPNTEPVAWTDGKGNYFDKNSFFPVDDLTPLYAHPAKTLTDEELGLTDVEISLIAEEFTGADGLDVVDFGRAILRKAQEK